VALAPHCSVAEHHAVEDVWQLWEAMARSFDTWLGLPHELLHAAGKDSVLAHVDNTDHPQRPRLLEHLHEIRQTTDTDAIQLMADRRDYYRQVLDELDSPQ
jgi:hypothetical protein